MRNIEDILYFRSDISPFLIHLTRKYNGKTEKQNLENILENKSLVASENLVSIASFGIDYKSLMSSDKDRFFRAVCFTETPLSEIHCLLEITGRQVDLKPYGLVFVREALEQRCVSPVLYLNNENSDQTQVIRDLCTLIETAPTTAEQVLPLISVFGNKITPPSSSSPSSGRIDFRWEREWRYPAYRGDFCFNADDVFIGICPHEEIKNFETIFPEVDFIDPTKNVKCYATKLIEARQRLKIKYSVV